MPEIARLDIEIGSAIGDAVMCWGANLRVAGAIVRLAPEEGPDGARPQEESVRVVLRGCNGFVDRVVVADDGAHTLLPHQCVRVRTAGMYTLKDWQDTVIRPTPVAGDVIVSIRPPPAVKRMSLEIVLI